MAHELITITLIFFAGLACGSFASVAVYRIPRDEQIWLGRSYCPSCKKSLKFQDLIPLLSWLFSGGKCRYCKSSIGISYFLHEVVAALLFTAIYLKFGLTIETLIFIPLALTLLIIVSIDLEHKIIPDSLQVVLLILAVLHTFLIRNDITDSLIGMLVGFGIAYLLRWVFFKWKGREALGWGDVKFFAIAGLFLGVWMLSIFLFISGILGTIIGFFWQKIKGEKEYPFGPALAVSLLICVLFPELRNLLI